MHTRGEQSALDPVCATSKRGWSGWGKAVTPLAVGGARAWTRLPVTAQRPHPRKISVRYTSAHLRHNCTQHTQALLPSFLLFSLFSCLLSLVSCLLSLVSCLLSLVSCLLSLVSCLLSLVSCLLSLVSCLLSLVSCLLSLVSFLFSLFSFFVSFFFLPFFFVLFSFFFCFYFFFFFLFLFVDFTCLNCFGQTHFATAVRLISILFSILWKSECFRHAPLVSVLTWHWCLIGAAAHLALCASAPVFLPSLCVSTLWLSLCALCGPHDQLSRSRHGSRTKQRASIHNISSTW